MSNFLLDDSFDKLVSQPNFSILIDDSDTELSDTEAATFELGFQIDKDEKPEHQKLVQTAPVPNTVETHENKENQPRFPTLVPDEMDGIANMCSEKSTHYQTKWAVKLFRGWYTI